MESPERGNSISLFIYFIFYFLFLFFFIYLFYFILLLLFFFWGGGGVGISNKTQFATGTLNVADHIDTKSSFPQTKFLASLTPLGENTIDNGWQTSISYGLFSIRFDFTCNYVAASKSNIANISIYY